VAKTEDEYWNIHDFCHTPVRGRLAAEKEISAVRHRQTREGKQRINNVQPRWFLSCVLLLDSIFITYIEKFVFITTGVF
jgi:hypothetical protein